MRLPTFYEQNLIPNWGILFLQNEHVLYFSNAFINSFFTVSTPGKPVCF